MKGKWFVYIITNYRNTVYYTGITNNLNRRIWEHKSKQCKNSFSGRYRLYKLVWYEEFSNPEEAILAEKKIKDFRREKKLNLIKSVNPYFQDLSTLC